MKIPPVIWQRLVNELGSTCPRCAETGEEVKKVVARLKLFTRVIPPDLGVEPQLEIREIDEAIFRDQPLLKCVR